MMCLTEEQYNKAIKLKKPSSRIYLYRLPTGAAYHEGREAKGDTERLLVYIRGTEWFCVSVGGIVATHNYPHARVASEANCPPEICAEAQEHDAEIANVIQRIYCGRAVCEEVTHPDTEWYCEAKELAQAWGWIE